MAGDILPFISVRVPDRHALLFIDAAGPQTQCGEEPYRGTTDARAEDE